MLGFGSIGEFALAEFSPSFNPNAPISDTDVLDLPINCVLAGQQLIRDRYRKEEIFAPRLRATEVVSRGTGGRLKGDKPSFTVTTNKKGYN